MPYGLKNAPAVFQSFVDEILRNLLGQGMVVYIDDILIYSATRAAHVSLVRKGFGQVAAPITSLLKGGPVRLRWSAEAGRAFSRLKELFTNAPYVPRGVQDKLICQESDSDSDSEELPLNLVAIENPESEFPLSTEEVPGPFEDAGGDGGRPTVDEVQEFCDRFLVLLRCLHFVNNATAILSDPLYKIRNVLINLTSAFGRVFVPYKDLCIDESLMLWKGRLAFRQYIPSKRHRFGVKFFVMCDVKTGFVQDIIVYTGSTTDIKHYDGLGVSGSVVMTMLAPHLGKGHTLYVDNWYSSPTLFQHLLSNSTGACGTVRSNRKGMPAFGCRKMQRGEVEFQENGQQLAVKWHDKRDVHVLSTVHTATMSATGKVDHLTGERKIKPDCVLDYNLKMGAVDKADMINSFVECTRKTNKWYKKIFFHLIDTAVLNGSIVHRQLTGKVITYQKYRENLMRELLEEHHTPRRPSTGGRPAVDNPLRLTARHFPCKVPQTASQGSRTRRHCKVCLSGARRSKQRKMTKYMCLACDTPLCISPCFEEYHMLKRY
ncbi:piggyBac transposable element-derived protein 4-like [Oncorhynchus nerka]|uniref:piggyBac transposable element-derived protein 4-like n=1 Tax=Oncorhynchus nerka TaxID=8023 RepID=UPI0031B85FAD